MNKFLVLVFLVLAVLTVGTFAKTKHQKMFEDLYLKTEDQLIADDFINMYALLVHRNVIAEFLIPGPGQIESWGDKPPFILINPQLVNLALGLGKNKIARLIIREVEKRRPRGFDEHPVYAGTHFPLPDPESEDYPSDMTSVLPIAWIEHQFVSIAVIPPDGSKASNYQFAPPMCICVLNRNEDCFDALIENKYKPTITSNRTYVLEPVLLAATLNAHDILPKLLDIGAPLDMQERQHVLTTTSPYHMGCIRGHIEWVQNMLRMGYDIDEQHGGEGDTCLHSAAQHGHFRLAQFLIERGADMTIIHKTDGQSAYSLSVQHHNRHVQALLAEGLLRQRLPLPPPPTLRQRLNDMERQDEIELYMRGYMARTGKTHDEIFAEMDVAAYDPQYDFNGTYDPLKTLGNPTRELDPDRIAKTGVASFLIEFDGVVYTAGTHSYTAKMEEYKKQEQDAYERKEIEALKETQELMALVDKSMALAVESERKELEEQKKIPKSVLEKTGKTPVDPNQTIPDFVAKDMFSAKLLEKQAKKAKEAAQNNQSDKSHKDEL